MNRLTILALLSIILVAQSCQPTQNQAEQTSEASKTAEDPLPSWNEAAKNRIKGWVENAVDEQSTDFIPVEDRIAVFDNDGTLWPEMPIPNQLQFSIDFLKSKASDHPEWKEDTILNGVLNGSLDALKEAGVIGLLHLINATHSGMTEDEFEAAVESWADTARHPHFDQRYIDAVYLPMIELLDYLRANDFLTFIVSGGGMDFMRPWVSDVYGIPSHQVIGSYGELNYKLIDGEPTVSKIEGKIFVDDKSGKPIAIHRFIGKKPVFCAGNSDGDQAMLQYTHSSSYNSFCMIVEHTDDVREFIYPEHPISGHLEHALVEAKEKDWMVVDMKNDFSKVFSFDE